MIQTIDHLALLPAYLAAGTAVVALLTDLAVARRGATLAVTATGTVAVAVAAWQVGRGPVRETFCLAGPADACSYVADPSSALVAVLFAVLTLAVLGLSAGTVRTLPAGEYCFLLACSMTGGVALAYSRDLITLIVALETLTLPLYPLVGLRRREAASAQGAMTFFVVSVVSIAVTLLGAALLYSATGVVHLDRLAERLDGGVPAGLLPLATVGAVLVVAGLAFKVAAVPLHAWAPATYDGAPVPIAAYLSTASKLGGVVAILYVVVVGLRPWLDVVGVPLAGLAVLTMTVGNLVALRQRRMVRLLAWSSVAQAGYILAPLGVFAVASGRTDQAVAVAVTATVAYTIFYVMLELGGFGSVVAARGGGADGGTIADYRGIARRAPLLGAVFTLALIGLAGLPPGLAGLFAKVAVVRSVLAGGAGWLAVVVALNAVVGLAYYVRVAALLYAAPEPRTGPEPEAPGRSPRHRGSRPVLPAAGRSRGRWPPRSERPPWSRSWSASRRSSSSTRPPGSWPADPAAPPARRTAVPSGLPAPSAVHREGENMPAALTWMSARRGSRWAVVKGGRCA
jgi:NADH-quinone oxidoreductase subunit N